MKHLLIIIVLFSFIGCTSHTQVKSDPPKEPIKQAEKKKSKKVDTDPIWLIIENAINVLKFL